MKLSTRSKYGLRAICYLAENEDRGYISVSEISENLDLSDNYLEQLIRLLKNANIVESTRGPKGGYKLVKKLDQITVGEVLRVLEGTFNVTGCLEDGSHCDNECRAYFAFNKLDEAINDTIDSITLDTMVNKNNSRVYEKLSS